MLARGEFGVRMRRAACAQGAHERRLYGRCKRRFAARRGPYRTDELLGLGVLEHVADRARLDGAEDLGVGIVGGDHEHRGCVFPGADRARRLHTARGGAELADLPESQVHEDDVDVADAGALDRSLRRRRLGDDLEIVLGPDESGEAAADDRMVVGEK